MKNKTEEFQELETKQTKSMGNQSNESKVVRLFMIAVCGIVGLIVLLTTLRFKVIHGNEYGVLETWTGGIQTNILMPGTHTLFPGFAKHAFVYDGSSQVFVMNDTPSAVEKAATGREKDAYLVQSSEGQDMHISMNLRWRIDPAMLIQIHRTVRLNIEEKIIRPVVMRVVKDEATTMKAMDAYSGTGLVELQQRIQKALAGGDAKESQELKERGIIIENFVIEHIRLDDNYLAEIKGKQIATLKGQRAVEEQKAAEKDAEVARSKAMAEYNTKLVAQQLLATNQVLQAQADNQKQIIAAEAQAKQVTIQAKAQAEQVTVAAKAAAEQVTVAAEAEKTQSQLSGEGQKLKKVAEAEGILAQGKAEAAAKQLMLESYAVKGADAYVKIQVAASAAQAFSGIKGYLPADMKINLLTGQFQGAVDALTGNPVVPVSSK